MSPRTTRPKTATPPPSVTQRTSRRKAPATTTAAMKATSNGEELIGCLIDVAWPSDDKVDYFNALVLSCTRRNQHKVIYIEDESIETLQLGSGPPYRTWRPIDPPSDNLVGSRIRFVDHNPTQAGHSWFDFMRANPNRRNAPFEAHVYARVADPDPSEVSGPRGLTPGNENYYRIVHAPNDYLTTVDLSSIDYEVVAPLKLPAEYSNTNPVIDAEDPVDDSDAAPRLIDDTIDAIIIDQQVTTPTRSRVRTNTSQSKTVAVIPDDEGLPENLPKEGSTNPVATNPSHTVIKVSLDGVAGNEQDKTSGPTSLQSHLSDHVQAKEDVKPNTKDDILDLLNDVDEATDAPPDILRVPDPSNSGVVPDQMDGHLVRVPLDLDNDKPSAPSKARTRRKIELDDPDTASDDDKLGSASKKEVVELVDDETGAEGGSQAGDYIVLDTGNGGPKRKAYVTAYLPSQNSHFVTFCDAKGGSMKIKLTKTNHVQMDDKEVEMLTRDQARQVVRTSTTTDRMVVVDDANRPKAVEEEEETVQPVPVKQEKRRASRSTRSSATPSSRKKSKRSASSMKILGKSAGHEIVSRCITVVWPNTKLVYVALVMGYCPEANQHMLLYMSDHCVEILELRYREWELLARGKEPWNSSGMVGRRIYVWWPGDYDEEDKQKIAEEMFGEGRTKVAYEAYILTFIGKTKYKIVYPCNEDCEERELDASKTEGTNPADKEWDLLEEGVHDVGGLPVIGWEG